MNALLGNISETVSIALAEDIGDGDKTTALLPASTSLATVICRETAILCGTAWFDEVFRQLDSDISIQWTCRDGDRIKTNDQLCTITGDTQKLLSGERAALNFLQTLSATATTTANYVAAIAHTDCKILDTRKTIPGLRLAQKYAVSCGGGVNHRIGLFDAILIKENHIMAAGSIHEAINQARLDFPDTFIEVEVENMVELEQAIAAKPDRILLDNFSVDELQQACQLNSGHHPLEASGNITLDNIARIAETGVNYISTGSITKHIHAIDLSMRIAPL